MKLRIPLATAAAIAAAVVALALPASASDPGGATHAPRWLSWQRATAADRHHFHVHGKCVIALTSSGHGWILCRNGESRDIPK